MIIDIKSYPNLSAVIIEVIDENDDFVLQRVPINVDNDIYRITVDIVDLPLGFYRLNLKSSLVLKSTAAIQVVDDVAPRIDESISILKRWDMILNPEGDGVKLPQTGIFQENVVARMVYFFGDDDNVQGVPTVGELSTGSTSGSFTVAVPSVLENSGYDPNRLIQYRGTTWNFTIYDLGDISNLTKIYFTLRKQNSDDESKSLVQIEKTAGLLISNGLVALEASLGSLTVIDDEEGTIQIKVSAEETKYYPSNTDNFVYDLKGVLANDEVKLVHKSKEFIISSDVTRKIT